MFLRFLTLLAVALGGYAFSCEEAPKGDEWQSPEELSLNKEYPHAWFFSFEDTESARKVLPENSSLWMSLDGDWKFSWAPDPDSRPADFYTQEYDDSSWDLIPVPSNWNVVGLGKDGSQKYGTPIYVNVNVPWFYKLEPGDWKEGVMRTPPEDYTLYKTRNEVGSYRRTFTVPEGWKDKDVYVDFDGVDSFFYLWVNGAYVGFSKNSRNLAEFNITEYLAEEGENLIAVEVYRFSDGANFEAQDMFRLPGIYRDVYLTAKNPNHIRDIKITPTLKSLNVELEAVDMPEGAKIDYELYENVLYSDENELVATFEGRGLRAKLDFADAKPWSAEAPHRYTLVGKLLGKDGEVLDIFSTCCGFRTVEIRSVKASEDEFGLAGKYFYINGKPAKLRGVNRHETHPSVGHAVTRDMMEEDIFLMKRANINHVRCSHYPDAPYWYYLCDKYGIYLMDEANLESHHYRYEEASLSHVPELLDAHIARMMEMVVSDYNHPSVIVWSMGNEAGPGKNFKSVYDAAKAYDPMRPVQYERNNDYSDFGCSQYPSVGWVRKVATGKGDVKYPYHINEFAHSMGNALGDFAKYWEAMDSSNFFTGGCVWDWVDQGIYNWTPDGRRYVGYGGDFGDTPNDGQFVMNGLLLSDRTPKPQYWEVKKVYQPVYATLAPDRRTLELTNRNYFEPVSYSGVWELVTEKGVISSGTFDMGKISPRSKRTLGVPYGDIILDGETFLNIRLLSEEDLPWAPAGYEVCKEQFYIGGKPAPAPEMHARKSIFHFEKDGKTTIRGKGFRVVFDDEMGTIHSLKYHGHNVIVPGEGPRLDVYRAFVNNDRWTAGKWFDNGLCYLEHKAKRVDIIFNSPGSYCLKYDIISQAPCKARLEGTTDTNWNSVEKVEGNEGNIKIRSRVTWKVFNCGRIECEVEFTSDNPDLVLGRLGCSMRVPSKYSKLTYFGRGPGENYPDRYTSSFVGLYESKVADQYFDYAKPQENGSHEGVRWATLTNRCGRGLRVEAVENSLKKSESGSPVMSLQTLPWSALDLTTACHFHELPKPGANWLEIDAAVLGLGGNSCGPIPEEEDILRAKTTEFAFSFSPAK